MIETDVAIIGGGIAGASLGARLAAHNRVVLLEMESAPGYHSTGRSAAYFAPAYGNETVRAVTAASADFYRTPPAGFAPVPLLAPRESLFVAPPGREDGIEEMCAGNPALERVTTTEMCDWVSILAADRIASGARDRDGGDLDVDAILQGFLRWFRREGGRVLTSAPVHGLEREHGRWTVAAGEERVAAKIVVNAAGAWADEIARLAGLEPLGLVPKRRTALLVDPPEGVSMAHWPLVIEVDEQFYFKPDAGNLLISPADETPSAPCDAQPDELDVAIAVDRFTAVTSHGVSRIKHQWAGLRTFAPDGSFVTGFDPRTDGFFWLAGQGGYGVQSAPGLSLLASDLVSGRVPDDPRLAGVVPAISPSRLIL
ncbi:MAG: FAD-binding oxidoreductase [Pseudomonadales bacterium]|nr:FAD-binding oxidoreductase [Pseudomonadales bacterium]